MYRGNALRCDCTQRRPRRRPALLVGEKPVEAPPAEVVSLTGQQPVRAVSDDIGNIRKLIKQRRGDYSGMDVDSGQINRDSTGCLIEFGAGRRQRLRPAAFVPAMADNDVRIGMASCVRGNTRNGIVSACRILQTEAGHGLTSLDEMHMGIHEGGADEPSLKINFSVAGCCPTRRVISTNEVDEGAIGDNGSRTRLVRRVDTPPDEDHEWSELNFRLDLGAVLKGNGEHRRRVGRDFSRGADTSQRRFQVRHRGSLDLQQIAGLSGHGIAGNDLLDML